MGKEIYVYIAGVHLGKKAKSQGTVLKVGHTLAQQRQKVRALPGEGAPHAPLDGGERLQGGPRLRPRPPRTSRGSAVFKV